MCRLIASALGALIGCTDATAPDGPADPDPPVHATRSDGRRPILDEFTIKDQAYLTAEGLDGAGDYYYRVTDADGSPLSEDAIACRRVHVDASGVIDLVYTGVEDGDACQHRCRFSVDGGLTLQLMPFGDSPTVVEDDGHRVTQQFRVEVSPSGDFGEVVAHGFAVDAEP